MEIHQEVNKKICAERNFILRQKFHNFILYKLLSRSASKWRQNLKTFAKLCNSSYISSN
jgi:hypothetical protein